MKKLNRGSPYIKNKPTPPKKYSPKKPIKDVAPAFAKMLIDLVEEKYKYKQLSEEYRELLKKILSRFYSIGGALNDNKLKYNDKQMRELYDIAEDIREVL